LKESKILNILLLLLQYNCRWCKQWELFAIYTSSYQQAFSLLRMATYFRLWNTGIS